MAGSLTSCRLRVSFSIYILSAVDYYSIMFSMIMAGSLTSCRLRVSFSSMKGKDKDAQQTWREPRATQPYPTVRTWTHRLDPSKPGPWHNKRRRDLALPDLHRMRATVRWRPDLFRRRCLRFEVGELVIDGRLHIINLRGSQRKLFRDLQLLVDLLGDAVVFIQVAGCNNDCVQGSLRLRHNVVLLIELERLGVPFARSRPDLLRGLAEPLLIVAPYARTTLSRIPAD